MVSPRASKSLITISSTTINNGLINNNNNKNKYNSDNISKKNHEQNETDSNNNYYNNCGDNHSMTEALQLYPRQQHEVFIGNLKAEESQMILITSLQELFKSVGVTVALFQFILCYRKGNNSRKYAFVLLSNDAEEEKLATLHETEGLSFVITGLPLIVTKRKSLYHPPDSRKCRVTFDGRRYLEHRPSKSETAVSESSYNRIMELVTPEDRTAETEICYRRVLYYGQNLPAEDRVTEYKRGSGNYIKHMLIHHVRKYVCAFLNSEGGRLMIGVDDDCKVSGISCTRKQEDIARCQIDNTIKHFQPHVLPNMYMIDFIPVKLSAQDNIELESIDPLLKVLEVSVIKQKLVNSLYLTDQEKIYVRRDGSVEGPLRISQIVEWCRVNFTKIQDGNSNEHCSGCSPQRRKTTNDSTFHDNKQSTLDKIATDQQQFLQNLKETIESSQLHLASSLEKLQKGIEDRRDEIMLQELRSNKPTILSKEEQTSVEKSRFYYCNIL